MLLLNYFHFSAFNWKSSGSISSSIWCEWLRTRTIKSLKHTSVWYFLVVFFYMNTHKHFECCNQNTSNNKIDWRIFKPKMENFRPTHVLRQLENLIWARNYRNYDRKRLGYWEVIKIHSNYSFVYIWLCRMSLWPCNAKLQIIYIISFMWNSNHFNFGKIF